MAPLFQQPFMMSWPSINRSTGFNLTGLKAYYKFNESSGNIINQATTVGSSDSNGEDLTTNSVNYSQTGIIGNGISFDAEGDYAKGSTASNWKFMSNEGSTFTWAGWIKYTGTIESGHYFWATNSPSTNGIGLDLRTGGNLRLITYTGGSAVSTVEWTSVVSDANWHFYVITFDDSTTTAELWADNSSQGTKTVNTTGTNDPDSAMACMARGTSVTGIGVIDEWSFWSRVLTSDEIASLYNSGAGLEL